MSILIAITIIIKYINYNYKRPTKTSGFTYLSEKTSSGKKSQLFRHFSFTTTFPDEIFYQTKTFLQTEAKVELQINFYNDISIVNRADD